VSRPEIVRTVAEVRARVAEARRAGRVVGLVPTMGALHQGHAALVRGARRLCDEPVGPGEQPRPGSGLVVVSVFVNPTQFGPGEDLASYPRDLEADVALSAAAGADLVFAPTVEEMYPAGASEQLTWVTVDAVSGPLCGASRPGHFRGVATVVAKLFNITAPDLAVFGEKDYQQLQVIRRMARDLNLPVRVIGHPTVREPDGLALSSRNRYLSDKERAVAPALYQALQSAQRAHAAGERRPGALRAAALEVIARAPAFTVDYVEVRHAETLAELPADEPSSSPLVLALAARLGRARLIDNCVLGT
jgi:pantoate--beta-alanine ligase